MSPKTGVAPAVTPSNKPVNAAGKVVPPLGFGAFADDDDKNDEGSLGSRSNVTRARSQKGTPAIVSVGQSGYTKEEIDVLRYI